MDTGRLSMTGKAGLACQPPDSPPACGSGWHGCNYCAGGISPKLHEVLASLGLKLPESVIQSRVRSLTIQGFWKNIELDVPSERQMVSVFRGSRPPGESQPIQSFDSFLLDQAVAAGAELINGEVSSARLNPAGKPVICYRGHGAEKFLEADFAVFATGVNEHPGAGALEPGHSLRALMPDYVAPKTRRALIFELHASPEVPASLHETIYFVEYGSRTLPLEMCSLVPKRKCVTVVLVGACVDAARTSAENRAVMGRFLELPHIRRLFSPVTDLAAVCACNPRMVIGSARNPYANRLAAVGDLVTARLYKDGLLSAHQTSGALADTVLNRGIDAASLREGYGPTLRHFARNNRFASFVFLLHRLFFGSSVLSRVLYQAVITERKSTLAPRRRLERILWRIASGDDEYEDIFWRMISPATIGSVLGGGALVTLRNYLTETVFGLRWEGFGRFTTGVSLERLEEKRAEFARLIAQAHIALPQLLEFERMYTIKIGAPREMILDQLENFGEADRGWLRPWGVRIRRVAGTPHEPGCVIRYEIFSPRFSFSLRLEQVLGGHLLVYRVMEGFARGGVLLFEIESGARGICLLSIYVAFNFARGHRWPTRLLWRIFRFLFPAFVHDVLWNHSLCQMRDLVETHYQQEHVHTEREPAWQI